MMTISILDFKEDNMGSGSDWWIPENLKRDDYDDYISDDDRRKKIRDRERRILMEDIIRNQEIIDENERLDAEDDKRRRNRGLFEL